MALRILKKPAVRLEPSPPLGSLNSTAIYPNRIDDRSKVEAKTGLTEFGNQETQFYTASGKLFAQGYTRVVYGDHGPYVEFDTASIKCPLYRKFGQAPKPDAFYDWLETDNPEDLKAYYQLKTVHNLKNPPPGGFKGNRPEGYADYQIGFIYVSPFELKVEPSLTISMDSPGL